jgi:hypothetical protein
MSQVSKKKATKKAAVSGNSAEVAKKNDAIRDIEAQEPGLLTEAQLDNLYDYLTENLECEPCNHSLRHTRKWLKMQKKVQHIPRANHVLRWMKMAGGFCDCEVLVNVLS